MPGTIKGLIQNNNQNKAPTLPALMAIHCNNQKIKELDKHSDNRPLYVPLPPKFQGKDCQGLKRYKRQRQDNRIGNNPS